MACDFVVVVPDGSAMACGKEGGDHEGGDRSVADVVLDCLEQIDRVEAELTVYRTTSAISRINQIGAHEPVPVSAPTFELLKRSMQLCQITEGAFDVTTGPLIDAWGFTNRQGRKPTRAEIERALSLVGEQHVILDEATRSVSLSGPGVRLNLGAIGKGEAIDRLTSRLHRSGVVDFLVHAGNSSVFASGSQRPFQQDDAPENPASTLGWKVGIAHPTKPRTRVGGIWLRDAAMATSGSGKQFFHHRGKRYGHVIDPRSGMPAGDLLSLSLCVPRAVDADALATGLFVLGRARAAEIAEERGWSLLMIASDERQDEVSVTTIGQWDWVEEVDTD